MTLTDLRRRLSLLNRHGNGATDDAERAFIRYARSRCFSAMNRVRAREHRDQYPEVR